MTAAAPDPVYYLQSIARQLADLSKFALSGDGPSLYVPGAFVLDHETMCPWHRGRKYCAARNAKGRPFKILAALLTRWPGFVSTAELVDHLYGDDPDGGPELAHQVVRATILHMRQTLSRIGISIICQWVWGYRIEWRPT